MRRSGAIVLLGIPAATVVAAAVAGQTYLSMLDHGHALGRIFAWQFVCWTFWALVAPLVLAPGRSAAHRTVLGALSIAAHALLTAAATTLIQPYQPLPPSPFADALLGQLAWLLPMDTLAYASLILLGWALDARDTARRLEVRQSQLAADLARAQLEVLRLEIQPHFLFNTLNAISALIRLKANDRALDMLVGLSELMRYTVDRGAEQEVALQTELEFVRRYVELQQARFGGRLAVSYDVEPAAAAAPVPTFLLQPIVENAVRHGLARTAGACAIDIQACLDAGGMRVSIGDRGVGLPPGFDLAHDAHTGLRNIRDRLQRLYGPQARLSIAPRDGGGTTTEVRIPPRGDTAAGATA